MPEISHFSHLFKKNNDKKIYTSHSPSQDATLNLSFKSNQASGQVQPDVLTVISSN